jgi:hypothetical protein
MSTNPFSFTYLGITDEQFAAFPENSISSDAPITFRITSRFPYQFSSQTVGCEVVVDFINPTNEQMIVRSGITCVFKLDDIAWSDRLNSSRDAVELEESIFVHFLAFTIGTLRGVIHVKQQNRAVGVLLPPVNAVEMIHQMPAEERTLSASLEK